MSTPAERFIEAATAPLAANAEMQVLAGQELRAAIEAAPQPPDADSLDQAAGNLEKTTAADIQKMVNLNFITAFNTVKPIFLKMKEKGEGRIFLIGARPAINMSDSTGILAYGISKSMIFRLAELLNAEAKGTSVVVHVIVPSTIDTPQNRKSMPDVNPEKWVRPSQIADIIHFYCSPAADPIREPVIKIYNQS